MENSKKSYVRSTAMAMAKAKCSVDVGGEGKEQRRRPPTSRSRSQTATLDLDFSLTTGEFFFSIFFSLISTTIEREERRIESRPYPD